MEHLDLDLLRDALSDITNAEWGERFEVRRELADGGVTGYLVRKNWRGVPFSTRQRELDDFLRERFGELAGDVSLIFSFTPEEYEAWAEDQIAV